MAFAIKAAVSDPRAGTFVFTAQKTMYGGKHIAATKCRDRALFRPVAREDRLK